MPLPQPSHRDQDRFIAAVTVALLMAASFIALIHHFSG